VIFRAKSAARCRALDPPAISSSSDAVHPRIHLIRFLPDILTPLVLFCDADIGDKVEFIFGLFDMDNSGSITIDELVLLMESTTKGCANFQTMELFALVFNSCRIRAF
jgi:hypothetical protein